MPLRMRLVRRPHCTRFACGDAPVVVGGAAFGYDAVAVAHAAVDASPTSTTPTANLHTSALMAKWAWQAASESSASLIALRRAAKAEGHAARGLKACGLRSFSGDTRVLMADGSTKPISKVRVGDRVAAADPRANGLVRSSFATEDDGSPARHGNGGLSIRRLRRGSDRTASLGGPNRPGRRGRPRGS